MRRVIVRYTPVTPNPDSGLQPRPTSSIRELVVWTALVKGFGDPARNRTSKDGIWSPIRAPAPEPYTIAYPKILAETGRLVVSSCLSR
jgi:hypothetical protein